MSKYSHLIENYDKILKKNISNNDTLTNYKSIINTYIIFCQSLDKTDKTIICGGINNIIDFVYHLTNKGLSNKSIRVYLIAIKHFYSIAIMKDLIDENPVVKFNETHNSIINESTKTRSLSYDGMVKLISCIDNIRDKCIIVLMCLEGLRCSEIQNLSIDDIDFNQNIIFIKKNNKFETVYPRRDVIRLLKKHVNSIKQNTYIDELGLPVFTSIANRSVSLSGKRLDRRNIRRICDKYLKLANLKETGISCDSLRFTCQNLLYNYTHNNLIIRRVMRIKYAGYFSKQDIIQANPTQRHTELIKLKKGLV